MHHQRMRSLVEKALPAHLNQEAIAGIQDAEIQSAMLQGRYQQEAIERWRIEQEKRRNSGMSIYE